MILIFGSYLDSSSLGVARWLKYWLQDVRLISNIGDHKSSSINQLKKDSIKSIWYRKYETYQLDEYSDNITILNSLFKEYFFYLNHLHRYFDGIRALGNGFHSMDPDKLFVLETAKKRDLFIPDYIVTTQKSELIEFKKRHELIITKPIREGITVNLSPEYKGTMYTSLVTDEIIDELPSTFFPSLFQEYIKKEIELRIFYLDGKFYSTGVFSQLKGEFVDYRYKNRERNQRMVVFKLPDEIELKLKQLMCDLNLNTGSIDMIKTKDFKYAFLEVNPVGLYDEISDNCNYYLDKEVSRWLAK
jgi:hypothetical protein